MTGLLCVGAGGALGAMGRYSLGLIVEATAKLGVLGQILPQNLNGHQTVQPVAPGLIHLGHTAGPHQL